MPRVSRSLPRGWWPLVLSLFLTAVMAGAAVAQEPAAREPDPNSTRYFFGPSARTLPQGQAYFAVYELFMPFVGYGLTDRVTVAGGVPILLGPTDGYYVAPKIQFISLRNVQLAAGVLALGAFSEKDHIGIAYGVATLGDADGSITLGLGWGFAGRDYEREPAVMVAGETRLNDRLKLITENYYVRAVNTGLVSAGVRFISGRLSADFGVGKLLEDSDVLLPLVNFSYTFGGER